MGGGIAHYVAAELNQTAIAFNPAPIKQSLEKAGRYDLMGYKNIQNFRGPEDPLTGITKLAILGPTPVVVKNVPTINGAVEGAWTKGRFWLEKHQMDSLETAMMAARKVNTYLHQDK